MGKGGKQQHSHGVFKMATRLFQVNPLMRLLRLIMFMCRKATALCGSDGAHCLASLLLVLKGSHSLPCVVQASAHSDHFVSSFLRLRHSSQSRVCSPRLALPVSRSGGKQQGGAASEQSIFNRRLSPGKVCHAVPPLSLLIPPSRDAAEFISIAD